MREASERAKLARDAAEMAARGSNASAVAAQEALAKQKAVAAEATAAQRRAEAKALATAAEAAAQCVYYDDPAFVNAESGKAIWAAPEANRLLGEHTEATVSYTHLTLPTILLV